MGTEFISGATDGPNERRDTFRGAGNFLPVKTSATPRLTKNGEQKKSVLRLSRPRRR